MGGQVHLYVHELFSPWACVLLYHGYCVSQSSDEAGEWWAFSKRTWRRVDDVAGSRIRTNIRHYRICDISFCITFLFLHDRKWLGEIHPSGYTQMGCTGRKQGGLLVFRKLAAGVDLPWDIWIVPLFWWGTLVVATLTLCIALISIFRKQWVEKERLNFPLVDVPLLMMECSEDGRKLPAFMRNKLFWIGFGLAVFKIAWNIPGYFNYQWPNFPPIRLSLARTPLYAS